MNKDRIHIRNNSTDNATGDTILIDISIGPDNLPATIKELERLVCQAKETLNQQAHKQKTWDQPEVNLEAPQEQENSTHNNDQKSLEKEQSQKTIKTSKKQYVISYPNGDSIDMDTGCTKHNSDVAKSMIDSLREGFDIVIPSDFKLQVIDL